MKFLIRRRGGATSNIDHHIGAGKNCPLVPAEAFPQTAPDAVSHDRRAHLPRCGDPQPAALPPVLPKIEDEVGREDPVPFPVNGYKFFPGVQALFPGETELFHPLTESMVRFLARRRLRIARPAGDAMRARNP